MSVMKHISVICTNHPDIDKIINTNDEFGLNNFTPKYLDGKEVLNWHHYLGGVYLHGKVESANGYDCVEIIEDECDAFAYRLSTDSSKTTVELLDIPTGTYECKVYGYDKPCTAFIWRHEYADGHIHMHGLIVDNEDKAWYEDAENKFNEKCLTI